MITKSYIYFVLFEEGSAEIPGSETRGIDQGIMRWPGMPDHRVWVVGLADAKRETMRIARGRAEAVLQYLADHGVEPARIDPIAAYTKAPSQKPEFRAQVRKVVVQFYNPHFDIPDWMP